MANTALQPCKLVSLTDICLKKIIPVIVCAYANVGCIIISQLSSHCMHACSYAHVDACLDAYTHIQLVCINYYNTVHLRPAKLGSIKASKDIDISSDIPNW